MSRLFYHVMQDNLGNLLFDVSGTMRLAGTGTVATIYGDEALTVPIANPMTNHPSFGSFKCFLPAGDFDFYMAKSGYTFETLTGVQGYGTMAQQNADNVSITGGFVNVTSTLTLLSAITNIGLRGQVAFGTDKWNIYCDGGASNFLDGALQVGATPAAPLAKITVRWPKGGLNGILLRPTDSDTGTSAIEFQALGGVSVGSIGTTASATSYNTSSDVRLKHAIAPLTGALDLVRRLCPITHLWRIDNSPGVGFLAHEVQTVAPEAVTGAPDAVDEAGQIVPQEMDYSKLVPYLVSAVKELTQQVERLQAKLAGA